MTLLQAIVGIPLALGNPSGDIPHTSHITLQVRLDTNELLLSKSVSQVACGQIFAYENQEMLIKWLVNQFRSFPIEFSIDYGDESEPINVRIEKTEAIGRYLIRIGNDAFYLDIPLDLEPDGKAQNMAKNILARVHR